MKIRHHKVISLVTIILIIFQLFPLTLFVDLAKVSASSTYENVANGKSVTASSVFDNGTGYPAGPEFAVDGQRQPDYFTSYYWASEEIHLCDDGEENNTCSMTSTNAPWILVDLGSPHTIDHWVVVSIIFYSEDEISDNRAKKISLEGSLDGENFEEISTTQNYNMEINSENYTVIHEDQLSEPITYRYFRLKIIEIYSNTQWYLTSVTEFELYGTPVLEGDTTPPTIANDEIRVSNITTSGAKLNWNSATDDKTNQQELEYQVYQSTSNNIDTVSNIEANGTPLRSDFSTNLYSFTVTGLTPNTPYYFNVIVKDAAGNKTAYAMQQVTTKAIPVMEGTVAITGNAKFGEMLVVDFSGISYTPPSMNDVPTYQWYRDGVAINGAKNLFYTLVKEDIGKAITVTVTADGTNATGSVTSEPTSTVVKANGPNAPNAPVAASKNTTSITLVDFTGQEYSKDSGITWQDSPSFNGLTPNTSYTFVTRVKETATHFASASSASVSIETEAIPVIGGTVTITGDAKFGSMLTADISGISYSPATANDMQTYQWERNGVAINGATSPTYTLVEADIGKTIRVTVTADEVNATGSVTSNPTSTIVKADGPNAPNAPVEANKDTTSITLVNMPGQEYSIDGGSWQDSPNFNGLSPNTDYTFVTRIKETATHFASANSASKTIKTSALPVIGGTVTITGNTKFGSMLTADISGISYSPATANDVQTYQWERDGVAINGATNLAYTLVEEDIGKAITVTVSADGVNATGSVTSAPTSTVVKADGPNAPNAPAEASKNTTSITLVDVTGQEYSIDGGTTWQDSPTFNGLSPNTDYTFVTRMKETATHFASANSASKTIKTSALPVIDGTVTITGDEKFGSMLTAETDEISYSPATTSDVRTFQWKRDGVAINGATNSTYTLVQDDIGKAITVTVSADGVNATGSVTSSPTNSIAKADGPNAPTSAPVEAGKNTTSITLGHVSGLEYSKDGGLTWQDSSTFTGLTPNTSYTFVTRMRETPTQLASSSSPPVTINTEAIPVIGGTVIITGDAKFGSMLTADISGISYSPVTTSDEPTFQWERDGVAINGATSPTYTLVEADIGKTIKVTVTADEVNATGSVTSNPTNSIAKADAPNAPTSAPVEAGKSTTSITLGHVSGLEYSKDGGHTWQDSSTFTGLTPNTSYTFVTRMKETPTQLASASSPPVTIKTEAIPVIGGTVTITGDAKFGSMLTADITGISYTPTTTSDMQTFQWERDGVAINGATNLAYTLVEEDIGKVITVTVSADGVNATGSVTSDPTSTIVKADGPNAPNAPDKASKNTTSITLLNVPGQEYSIDGGITWQDSPTFNGLTPNTSYTFVTRMKETATHLASTNSTPVTIKTEAPPVSGGTATIGGTVTITGNPKFGQTLTANISGISYSPTTTNDVPTFQWKRNGVAIHGATSQSYTLVQDDIGKVITFTITADGTNATGSVTSSPTSTIVKADGPNAPNAPVAASKNTTSITLVNVLGQEYSMDNGISWQDSPSFNGLTPNTSYTFVTRVKETATHFASASSAPVTIKAETSPVISGTVTITGNPKFGQTLTANIGGISYSPATTNDMPTFQWKRDGVAINSATSLTYTLVEADIGKTITFTITADGANATGSVTSNPTSTIVKADGANAPNAPVEASKNTTSITLVNVPGQEYSINGGNSWQDSPNFNGLTPNTSYTFVTRVKETATHFASASSAPVMLKTNIDPLSYIVTYIGNNNTTGTVPTDANSYKKGSLVTVSGNTGHLEKTGYIFAGWNTQADGNGTNYVAGNIITIETSNITLYAKWIEASNGNDGTGTSDNNAPSTPSTPTPTNTGVDVLVNGKAEKAGTATTNLRNEQTVTTIAIDEKKLDEKLEAEGQHAVVTIPVNTKSDVVVGELNGQMVKNMENKQAVLEMKTERATYTLPAKQININAISEQFGKSIALEDIKVQIEIGVPSAEMSKVIENVAETGTFSLVVPPLEFTISCTFGDQSINLSTFNAYVERIIAIPDDVDPNKITTGVVVDLDGTVRHVPTKITQIEGKYYAVINSLTNSIYSVVWHPLEFSDVANHWAKNAVNNMGSRMVVDGTENGLFSPDKEITRAEFAAIIVRGLGLKPENGATPFSDVKESDWYNNAINTAYEYQLINGFEDHTFRPNDKITREQAMVIIDRAMQITELKTKLPVENAIPQTYLDQADASIWAQRSIADCLQAGIVLGRNSEILAPKDFITRAEVAMIMERLLQKSNLI